MFGRANRDSRNVEIHPVVIPTHANGDGVLGLTKRQFFVVIAICLIVSSVAVIATIATYQLRQDSRIARNTNALQYVCKNQIVIANLTTSTILYLSGLPTNPARQAVIKAFQRDLVLIDANDACSDQGGG